ADEALPAFDAGALSLADDAAPGQDDEPGTDAGTETETVADDAPSSDAGTDAGENDADDGAGLSLVADDAAATFAAAGKKTTDAAPSIEALEQRISGLSLADVDSYGHGPERGAVLVEGGLGGPDAVRQLLAAIPAGFPRPVLVRLQLDGGRYDRLVRQMERAALLPVQLAEAGGAVEPGRVYFLPPELDLRRDKARLVFDAG